MVSGLTRREEILVNDLPIARNSLDVLEAITVAAGDAHAVLDVLLAAPDPDAARIELQQRYGFTEVQATAVMDLQLRRVTSHELARLAERRAELVEQIAALEEELRSDS